MGSYGKKWGVLLWATWETTGWAKKNQRRKSLRRFSIWSKCSKAMKVTFPLYCIMPLQWFYIVCCFPHWLCLFVLGKPFNVTKSINYAVSNIISSIIYGSRFDYSDEEFKQMVNRANDTVRLSGTPSVQVPLSLSLNKLKDVHFVGV